MIQLSFQKHPHTPEEGRFLFWLNRLSSVILDGQSRFCSVLLATFIFSTDRMAQTSAWKTIVCLPKVHLKITCVSHTIYRCKRLASLVDILPLFVCWNIQPYNYCPPSRSPIGGSRYSLFPHLSYLKLYNYLSLHQRNVSVLDACTSHHVSPPPLRKLSITEICKVVGITESSHSL